jgi:ribose transport system permease protein
MVKEGWSAPAALTSVVLLGALLGLLHGVLIVVGRLQPFVVTLCGMLIYRGIARWFTSDSSMGYSDRYKDLSWLVQKLDWTQPYIGIRFPPTAFILIVLGVLALIALNQTIYGRYLLAVGRNEQAARYSGINTGWVTILSYVISGFCAGLGGVLFSLDVQSAQATSLGLAYEFHAIAAAVLGGCSLRGGEGSIFGVVIGATLLQVLRNSLRLIGIPDRAVDCVIGLMILGGVAFDEMVRRISARRRGS